MKNLPIQFVQTRGERDVFLKEGGGSDELPKWVTNEAINHNVAVMRESFIALEDIFNKREDSHNDLLPVLTMAILHEKATAKSYRGNVRQIFDDKNKRNVIGMSKSREVIVKIDSRNDLHRISSNYQADRILSLGKTKRCGIAAIVGLEPFHAQVEEDLTGHPLKVRLIDYLDSQLNDRSEQLFLQLCRDCELDAKKVDYASGVRMFFIANIQDMQSIQRIATMDAVISVKKMPYIELSISPEPYNTKLDVKEPVDGEEYPHVGLLDSGIASIPHLAPWIQRENQNVANFDENDLNFRHGTAVAGVLNYGDELEGTDWTGCSPMRITSCIVNTTPDKAMVQEIEMIEHIRSAIEANPKVRVWNLSQGSTLQINDDCFSDFAMALDDIQKTHNVLFCKSAGNIDWRNPNENRITLGADSVLSLVVGSIADKYEREGDVPVGQRSPFSRIGPGPECLIKPDLVHYGGNKHAKIHSFTEVGYECNVLSGTSFSTPRVSALAANLAHRICKDFDSSLIKALLIHGASYQNTDGLDNVSLLHEQGYGLPSNLNAMLNNDEDEFTMIWQPNLDQGDAQIQDIPFPSSMVGDDGLYYGEVIVTVVTDPILKTSEGTEYCQSDVEVLLQTYDDIHYQPLNAIGTPRYYRNSERLVNPQNILAKGNYSQRSLHSADWEERTLIETAFKYQPVKKFHINLENMTPQPRRNYLSSNKKWCLSVKALYRDAVVTERDYDGIVEHMRATIIITIKDTRHKGIAYSECLASLNQHNFVHSNIEIRQRIDIENG